MDSLSASVEEEEEVNVIVEAQSITSSEEPPIEEWSSLELEVAAKAKSEINVKKVAYEQGLYDPGVEDICTMYIPISDDNILHHPLRKYPPVTDPGIVEALLEPIERVVYPDDGVKLYLDLCKEMDLCPIRIFHRNLTSNVINLNHYGVDPRSVRALGKAMKYNKSVKILSMKDNFLTPDAAFHIGEMLITNSTLVELNLEGCRIGPEGAQKLFAGLVCNRTLRVLNLNGNKLEDGGGKFLADSMILGTDIKEIYLKNNCLSNKTALSLAEAFEYNNQLTCLDMSWNNLYTPVGTSKMLHILSANEELEYLNLSWNNLGGPRISAALKELMLCPNLTHLVLNNNNFQGEDIDLIKDNLNKAKKLVTLDLSFNPLTTVDALKLIHKLKHGAVKCKHLKLDSVNVDGDFVVTLEQIKKIKSKRNVIVTYGSVCNKFLAKGTDPRELILKRADFLGSKVKRNPKDIALVFLQLAKEKTNAITIKEYQRLLKVVGIPLDHDLIVAFGDTFSGPRSKKDKTIDVRAVVDYIRRLWPERELPEDYSFEAKPKKRRKRSLSKVKKTLK